MLRIVPHTVPRVGRAYERFPDGFELHLLPNPQPRRQVNSNPLVYQMRERFVQQITTSMYTP